MERIYPLLFQYLLSNKILLLPKIGTFSLSNIGARYDYPTQAMQAPFMDFTFQGNVNSKKHDQSLYAFLDNTLENSAVSSEQEVDDFSDRLLQQLEKGDRVRLPGIGTLRYINEKVILESSYNPKYYLPDQPVLPAKRETTTKTTAVRPGDIEYIITTKQEIVRVVNDDKKKQNWWIFLLVVIVMVVLVIVLCYYMIKVY